MYPFHEKKQSVHYEYARYHHYRIHYPISIKIRRLACDEHLSGEQRT